MNKSFIIIFIYIMHENTIFKRKKNFYNYSSLLFSFIALISDLFFIE